MKQLSKLILLAVLVTFASCQKESNEPQESERLDALRFENGIVVSDGEEDKELMFNAESETIKGNNGMFAMTEKSGSADVKQVYTVIDADRAPNSNDGQPISNMWWSITGTDYDSPSSYFSTVGDDNLVFTEYEDGTAHLVGTTVSGTCSVDLDVWFKDKKTWDEWEAIGGGHKKEGTAGNASNSEDMSFYVIDDTRSTVTASGGDCDMTGTFGLTQRPDPNDPSTPNYGSHIGPGGANYDSNVGALGLSAWGWFTDLSTGEHLYIMDFNFRLEAQPDECDDCIGKVTNLTLNWDWHHDYRVRVYQRYGNTCYATKIFDGVVGANENFTINGANNNGTFGKWVYIYVGNCYYTKIKTNCYLNIGPGYRRGVVEVVSGYSSQGGELCEYEPPHHWCWWW